MSDAAMPSTPVETPAATEAPETDQFATFVQDPAQPADSRTEATEPK